MSNFTKCNIYNMSSVFFDFFRIYYRVEGWDSIVRDLIAKISRLYPEKLEERGPDARPLQEWTSAVNSSRAAAKKLQAYMSWRAEQAPYRHAEGRYTHLLVLTGGLRTSPHNLTGYYRQMHGQLHVGRPVYQQLLLDRDLEQGRAPNYVYSTTEWYSNIEMWAVGPVIGATDAWIRVTSDAEAPHEITAVWQELSESFPVGYHANPDIYFLPAASNVSQAEFALEWAHAMLGRPINDSMTQRLGIGRDFEGYIDIGPVTDAERCFVCSCASENSWVSCFDRACLSLTLVAGWPSRLACRGSCSWVALVRATWRRCFDTPST